MQAGEKLPGNCVRATVTRGSRKQGNVFGMESDNAALNNVGFSTYVDFAARGRAAGGEKVGGSWVNFHYGLCFRFCQ